MLTGIGSSKLRNPSSGIMAEMEDGEELWSKYFDKTETLEMPNGDVSALKAVLSTLVWPLVLIEIAFVNRFLL